MNLPFSRIAALSLTVAVAFAASAQQLPNVGFSQWKGAAGNTFAIGTGGSNSPKTGEDRQRPGDEPTGWNGSSINQKVMMTKEEILVTNIDETVMLTNKFVGIKIGSTTIGSNAPAFINFGTPWVYAESNTANCDGGVYGGIAFTASPDAVKGRFKRTDTNPTENSYIIAYLWKGTFKSTIGKAGGAAPQVEKDDVDRAVLGRVTPTQAGTLIAKAEKTFTSTQANDWETITVPLEYQSDEAPEKCNVIISAGDYWTRANVMDGTTLYADDVRFVYYSRPKKVTAGNESFSFSADDFDPATGQYTGTPVKFSTEYLPDDIEIELEGRTTTATPGEVSTGVPVITTESRIEGDKKITTTTTVTPQYVTYTFTNGNQPDIDGLAEHTLPMEFAKTVKDTDIVTAIDDIDADSDQPVIYYDLQGRKVDPAQMGSGVYIRRQGSKVTKVRL